MLNDIIPIIPVLMVVLSACAVLLAEARRMLVNEKNNGRK